MQAGKIASRRRSAWSLGAIVLATAPTLGCGALAHDVARSATPGVVAGAAEAIADPKNQQKIADGVDPKILQTMTGKIVDGVVDGSLDALGDPERQARLRKEFIEVTRGFQLPMSIAHIDSQTMADVVDASVERLTTPERMLALRAGVGMLVREVVSSAFAQSREELASTDVEAGVSHGARDLAKQVTLGFQDAIDENARRKREGELTDEEGNVLENVDRAGNGLVWVPIGAAIAVVLVAGLIGAIIWAGRRVRASRADLAHRDHALEALMEVLAATDQKPWAREFRSMLSEKLHDRENVDHLRRLMKSRPSSIDPPPPPSAPDTPPLDGYPSPRAKSNGIRRHA